MSTSTAKGTPGDSPLGLVFEIQKLSTEDGPGIRTTVFFKHCPLRCAWCHNPESIPRDPVIEWFGSKCMGCGTCVEVCPRGAVKLDKDGVHIDREKCVACGTCVDECPTTAMQIFGTWWTLDELFAEVDKDRVYYEKSGGGVTVSGGEPTLQPAFVVAFLEKLKRSGISTALDTCGFNTRETYERFLPHVDLFLYDLKEIDPDKHLEYTGVPNDRILENCKWLTARAKELGKEIWVRTPVIPGYTATDENIRGIAEFIVDQLENKVDRWDLLAFNNLARDKYRRLDLEWKLEGAELFTREDMEHFYEIAVGGGVRNVQWSGLTRKD
ncbi:MAG: glycyl-radical enzyme activating protein [Promethearchaeota archaeon]